MKTIPAWAKLISYLPANERYTWFRAVIAGIKSYRKGTSRNWLSDIIKSGREFRMVGFVCNLTYVRMDSSTKGEVFIHKWGAATLALKHKRLPIVVLVGPGIRLDETALEEENGNINSRVEGFTG